MFLAHPKLHTFLPVHVDSCCVFITDEIGLINVMAINSSCSLQSFTCVELGHVLLLKSSSMLNLFIIYCGKFMLCFSCHVKFLFTIVGSSSVCGERDIFCLFGYTTSFFWLGTPHNTHTHSYAHSHCCKGERRV